MDLGLSQSTTSPMHVRQLTTSGNTWQVVEKSVGVLGRNLTESDKRTLITPKLVSYPCVLARSFVLANLTDNVDLSAGRPPYRSELARR
jgi:hypothetical protein